MNKRPKKLTVREEKFATEYAKHTEPSRAYKSAYSTSNMKSETISGTAQKVMRKPHVAARIEQLRERAQKRAEMGVFDVLKNWVDIATADPNEIVKHTRRCCRHCYGLFHAYQWVSDLEYAIALAKKIDSGKKNNLSDKGGYGFNATLEPYPSCPICFGEGIGQIFIADTEKLTGAARRLYGGAKQTKYGVEIIFRNQDAALENIAKFLGMFKNGEQAPPGQNISKISEVTNDPVKAAKIYAEIITGK